MYTSHNTIKISDLRKHTAEVIDEISESDQPVFIFSRSEPKGVFMSLTLYRSTHKDANLTDAKPSAIPKNTKQKRGIDFFIDPPEDMLIKTKGLDAVKLIRAERD